MRTITLEDGKEIEISQESYDALNEKLESGYTVMVDIVQKKRWKPVRGSYFVVNNYGDVIDIPVRGDRLDDFQYAQRNMFKTKEEAQKHLKYLKALAVLKDDAEDWEPDWGDETQERYYVYYDSGFEELLTSCNVGGPTINLYFETREKAEHSIDTHRDLWLTVFNVKN